MFCTIFKKKKNETKKNFKKKKNHRKNISNPVFSPFFQFNNKKIPQKNAHRFFLPSTTTTTTKQNQVASLPPRLQRQMQLWQKVQVCNSPLRLLPLLSEGKLQRSQLQASSPYIQRCFFVFVVRKTTSHQR